MAFAALWESFRWSDETVLRTFTIMTTTPNAEMSDLHDQYADDPGPQDWPTWLGEAEGDDCTAPLRPAPDGFAACVASRSSRGSSRNNGPEFAGDHRSIMRGAF
jgi:putative SOS response-associated peptidase YedK